MHSLEAAFMSGAAPERAAARGLDALVERARGGDVAAFEGLMDLTERRVLAIAGRLLGSREEARDAAQEVFLRVYRHLDGFRPGADFLGWLYRIAVNVCHDMARRRGRTVSFEDERDSGRLAEPGRDDPTEEELLRIERWRQVRDALALLPPRERAALVLRDLEGMPTEEVARILGSRPATVRSQVCVARAKVRAFCDRLLAKGRTGGAR